MTLNYSWEKARLDLLAGVTVAAISLPQAMAYALIAGVDPRFGLYSAIVVTFVAAIFGSSSHLINGPTNAISLVVFSSIAFIDPDARFDAYQATFLLGIMVGCIQILISVFKLGDLTRYISESVVVGFITGAGFLIVLSQVANFFGIKDRGTGHQHVLLRFWLTVTQGGPVNGRALGIGIGTVIAVVLLRYLSKRYKLPQLDMLVALIIATVIAFVFGWSEPLKNGKTILSVVGNVPATLPMPHIPEIKFWWIKEMSGSAVAVACLGLLEALAISKAIANTTRQALDFNRQCMAEGLANLTGGFFQCLPGSGSLTRSAINFQAGAVSRLSGVFAAATVALVLLAFAPLMRFIPKAALAGLLLVTAARLIDWKRLNRTLRSSRYDTLLVLLTAFVAVFVSVEYSILIGVAVSILLFVPRVARLRGHELTITPECAVRDRIPSDPHCTGMIMFDLEGELFFGAAPDLDKCFAELRRRVLADSIKSVILRVKRSRNPDMVCLELFQHFMQDMLREGVVVLICGVRPEFARAIKSMGFYDWLPEDRVFFQGAEAHSSTIRAVRHAYQLSDEHVCPHCIKLFGVEQQEKLYYMV
jgi:SulP family sulfate permease